MQTPAVQVFPHARSASSGVQQAQSGDNDRGESFDSDSEDDTPTVPPVLISPIKPRRKQPKSGTPLHKLDDLEVWDRDDEEIVGKPVKKYHFPMLTFFV